MRSPSEVLLYSDLLSGFVSCSVYENDTCGEKSSRSNACPVLLCVCSNFTFSFSSASRRTALRNCFGRKQFSSSSICKEVNEKSVSPVCRSTFSISARCTGAFFAGCTSPPDTVTVCPLTASVTVKRMACPDLHIQLPETGRLRSSATQVFSDCTDVCFGDCRLIISFPFSPRR